MAFTRKNLGSGQLGTSETTMYSPSSGVSGVIGALTFYNTHTTSVEVTVYKAHSGAATTADIMEKFTFYPGDEHVCRVAINKVVEGSGAQIVSALATVASVVNYDISGAEE